MIEITYSVGSVSFMLVNYDHRAAASQLSIIDKYAAKKNQRLYMPTSFRRCA